MTDKRTPPDWVLIEAAKRSGITPDVDWIKRCYGMSAFLGFRALCDMIERYEQPPVDRKLLCAREAAVAYGFSQDSMLCDVGVRAIELWIEGYGE